MPCSCFCSKSSTHFETKQFFFLYRNSFHFELKKYANDLVFNSAREGKTSDDGFKDRALCSAAASVGLTRIAWVTGSCISILAEGAIALSVTLSGGALFAN